MTERCLENDSAASGKSLDELKQIFPNAKTATSAWDLTKASESGVYLLDAGVMRMIKIVGPCPNFTDGSCKLAERCFSGSLGKE